VGVPEVPTEEWNARGPWVVLVVHGLCVEVRCFIEAIFGHSYGPGASTRLFWC
jgi:hypothetical protein